MALWAVAGDDDLLADLDAAVLALGVALGPHRAVVGQFLVQLVVELFARDLGGEQALAGVGDLVFGIMPRPLGHQSRRGGP